MSDATCMRTPEQLEVEAHEVWTKLELCERYEQEIVALSVWAARIQRDAVDEERKALREIVEREKAGHEIYRAAAYSQPRYATCNRILAALDARSKR